MESSKTDLEMNDIKDISDVDHKGDSDDVEEYKRALRKNYQTFSKNGKNQIGWNAMYAVINLGVNEKRYLDWLDVVDTVEAEGKLINDLVSNEDFEFWLEKLTEKTNLTSKAPAPAMFFASFIFLLIFPFTGLLAFPFERRETWVTNWASKLYRDLLRIAFLPRIIRRFISHNILGFLFAYCFISLFYILTLVNFLIALTLELKPRKEVPMNVVVLEAAIPLVGWFIAVVMMAAYVTVDDKGVIQQQNWGLRGCSFHDFKVKPASKNQKDEVIDDAEDILMRIINFTPEMYASFKKWSRLGYTVSVLIGIGFCLIPFALRLLHKVNEFGKCSDPNKESCTRFNDEFVFISVSSFFLGVPVVIFWVNMLFQSYFVFVEKNLYIDRVGNLLNEKGELPYLPFEHPENVVAWAKIREYVQKFKAAEMRRVELVLGSLIVILLCFIPPLLWQRIYGPFKDTIHKDYVSFLAGVLSCILGTFLIYPILLRGLAINLEQMKWGGFVASEKFRTTMLSESESSILSKEAKDDCKKSGSLLNTVQGNMKDSEAEYILCILGVTITPTLVNSMATTVFGLSVTWFSDIIFPSD